MSDSAVSTKKFAYYPGCSLKSSAAEYDHSTRAVFERLGIDLQEVPGWSCCGASSAHTISRDLAVALPLRNLALAEPAGLDIVAPCASCYNRLKVAETTALEDPAAKKFMEEVIERPFNGTIKTLSVLDLLTDHVGLDTVKKSVSRRLTGLKVVSYYGCLLARPPKKLKIDDPDNPTSLDDLMEAIGAEPKFWSYKTECCGAGHAMARSDIVTTLVGKLHEMAREAGAEAIVVACPMCHANVDMRQDVPGSEPLPVFFFTELMALAMGMDVARGWLGKHLVSPMPLLQKLNLI
ncbi:MAG: CoB--CoM heterodisulfide reductase iron-sulfur subunit B family protein [bacterium]